MRKKVMGVLAAAAVSLSLIPGLAFASSPVILGGWSEDGTVVEAQAVDGIATLSEPHHYGKLSKVRTVRGLPSSVLMAGQHGVAFITTRRLRWSTTAFSVTGKSLRVQVASGLEMVRRPTRLGRHSTPTCAVEILDRQERITVDSLFCLAP